MNRVLKVDFSDSKHDQVNNHEKTVSFLHSSDLCSSDRTKQSNLPNYNHNTMPSNGTSLPTLSNSQNNSSLPSLPPGVDLPAGLSCPDAISRTLNTLPPAQLLDVLSQMKTLATTDPSKATELLHQAPQLSYAIFQALLLMGLVSAEALSTVIESSSALPPTAAPPPPMSQGYGVPPPGTYPSGFPPPPPHMAGQLGMHMGTPPVSGHGLYPPPPVPAPQRIIPPPQQAAPVIPDADALMQQVLAMPQELIDSLPPNDRAQLLALRASYGR